MHVTNTIIIIIIKVRTYNNLIKLNNVLLLLICLNILDDFNKLPFTL